MLAIYFKEFRDHFGVRTDDLRHRPPDSWFTDSSSSASSTPTDDGPFLQCALCRDRYNKPKVLPCLHTFCEGCLISHTPKDSLTLTCPICRHQSILPKNGVMGLQDNLIVSNITGVLEPRKDRKHCGNVSKGCSNNESFKYRNDEKLKELPPIEENIQEQKNHLKNLLSKAISHIPILKEDIHSIAVVVENLNENHHQAKSDMFHCLEDLENTLKDKKTQLVDELDRIHKEKFDVLQQQKHLLEMCLSSLEEHCQSAEQILTDGSDEELAVVYCEMAEKLEDFVETDLQKSPIENDFVAYDISNITELRAKLKCLDGVRTCRASPCESILEADPSKAFEIGDTLTWILAVRDSRGLSTDVDPLILTINLRTPDNTEVTPEIINKNGGNYVINYVAKRKGVYGLTVKFHGQHVRGSPYLLTCSTKQPPDGNSAKLHRQTITESLYLAANKAKELKNLTYSKHVPEPQEHDIDNKQSIRYDSSFDKHCNQQKSSKYVNRENVDYKIPSSDMEQPEIARNSGINLMEVEPTRIYSPQTMLSHAPTYNKQIPERPHSPVRRVKEAIDLSTKFHSEHLNTGSPRLSRAHQDLKTVSNKSNGQQTLNTSHSPTRKSKGTADSTATTYRGQHIIGSPRLSRSHQSHAVIPDKRSEKQQIENNHLPVYKTRSHMQEASSISPASPPTNRLQRPQEKIIDASHGHQVLGNTNSPISKRKEILEHSSPKLRRNTSLRSSCRGASSHGPQITENSPSPTCRRKPIETSSPKLHRQHSLRTSSPAKTHHTDSYRKQQTPSPTHKYKEMPDLEKGCVYHPIGSPSPVRARFDYEVIDKARSEEAIKASRSPLCKRRETPILNLPRQPSISSSSSGRATHSRDVSPDKFNVINKYENPCDTDLKMLSSDGHRIKSPLRCDENNENFNDVFPERDVENAVESNYTSAEMTESQLVENESPTFEKLCDPIYKGFPESTADFYPTNCTDDVQYENKENVTVSSSCEANFGPVDNDLLIKIGRRGSKKGEFINLQGVCCTNDNKIVVADSNNQCVQVFDNEGNFLLRFGSRGRGPGQMQRPTGVAVTPAGNYLVADYENRCVNVFKPDGEYCKRFGSKKLLGPRGLTVTKDGNVIVVDNKASCLYIMQDNGKILGKIGAPGCGVGRFSGPHYVALDTSNRLVITDFHNHQVHIFLLDGSHVATFGSNGEGNGQFNAPTGVAVDSQDNIIVADWGNNRLQVFDSNGSFLSFINTAAEPVFGPQDLTLTNDGHVVVADSGNHCLKIYKYLQ